MLETPAGPLVAYGFVAGCDKSPATNGTVLASFFSPAKQTWADLAKLDKTAAAGVAAAMALDGQGHVDGSAPGLTALDLVRLVRALKEADARALEQQ